MAFLSNSAPIDWGRILAAAGQGFMQAGTPGGNFGQGLMQGAQFYDQTQDRRQGRELEELRLDLLRQEQEANRLAHTKAAQEDAALQALLNGGVQTASAQPVRQIGNYGASVGGAAPATQSGGGFFDPDVAAKLRMLPPALQRAAVEEQIAKMFAAPEKPKGTDDIREYELAKSQGFTGTFFDYQKAVAELGRGPQQPTERHRNALAAGLQPGTPEFQQYMLGRDDTAPGPFQGTGLDAQSYNIVLTGDPASPEYSAAYAQLAMPKVTFDPVTQKLVSVEPDMSWARQPAGAGAPRQRPQAPAGGDTMQLPGATVTSTQGTPIYNEGQGKAAGFADRMAASNNVFEQTSTAGTSPGQQVLSGVPVVGNYLISSERQKFEQAERDFINAQLRRESGAVINPEEFAEARKQYIPQPGDDPPVLAQKQAARERALRSMQREGGPFYKPEQPQATPKRVKVNEQGEVIE